MTARCIFEKRHFSIRDIRARESSQRIIIAYTGIEFVLLDTVPYLALLSGIKKILLTVIQTVKSHVVSTASVSRDDVPERGSWTYDSLVRSSRILRVPPRKRYCYNRRGVFEENRVAPRRPMAGTGRRKGLYRRLVYWVACDRWKKVSLSAASSEIPRRPWRTTSLAVPFSTAGSRRLFVRAVSFVRDVVDVVPGDKVKEIPPIKRAFQILKGFVRVTSMSTSDPMMSTLSLFPSKKNFQLRSVSLTFSTIWAIYFVIDFFLALINQSFEQDNFTHVRGIIEIVS